MNVKKVMTFKSGKFAFSHNFSQTEIQPLEIEFKLLYNSLRKLPILPSLAYEFEIELTRRSIFSTAAIEGNPLRENEVGEIIDNLPQQNSLETKNIEIQNLKKAYDQIAKVSPKSAFTLSENFIGDIHKTIADQLNYDSCIPGKYRNHIVKVGDKQHGGVATPPKCLKDIQNLMAEYILWFNSNNIQNLTPVIQSVLAHYYLAQIHPFADGNGRTARLIEATILRASGIKYLPTMLSNYYYRNIDEYFIAFSQCRQSKDFDITPFLKFALIGAIQSLNEVKERITTYITASALHNYFKSLREDKKITKRQLELLNSLLESPEDKIVTINSIQRELPFRVLYATVTDRTARRDLMNLHELELIKTTETGFKLNRQILNAL